MKRILITGGSGFIGKRLVDQLAARDLELLNLDLRQPEIERQARWWRACDIKDREAVLGHVRAFRPDTVLHLAARTDLAGTSLADYADNSDGTRSLVDATMAVPGIERLVVYSTQFVIAPGIRPNDLFAYSPYSIYGQSKVETEQIVRRADPDFGWTIVRPTIVWGPWHPTMPNGIWHYIAKRWYLHPGGSPVRRAYAWVGNVVHYTLDILERPVEEMRGQTFYLGDPLMDSLEWVNAFSRRLCGRDVPILPRAILSVMGRAGDSLNALGLQFPFSTARYNRMTTSDAVPIETTIAALGPPAQAFEEAVDETVDWLGRRGLVRPS